VLTRELIESRPRNLWRYRELLPIDGEPRVGLHSGFTPLVRADRLGAVLGVRELYVKDDSVNHPTFSYKDRVVSVAISKAIEFGFDTVSCASTGKPRNSVARTRARRAHLLHLHPDDLEQGKGHRLDDLRAARDRDPRQLRRREPPLQRGRRQVRLGVRQHQRAARTTPRARRHTASRSAEQLGWRLPAAHRRADRGRHHPAEGREGVPRAPRPRASSRATTRSTRAGGGLRAGDQALHKATTSSRR
jgi:hypothetical protein